jgi:hypothetical protein
MAQIEGRKRFLFFPPRDLKCAYKRGDDGADHYANLRNQDLKEVKTLYHIPYTQLQLDRGTISEILTFRPGPLYPKFLALDPHHQILNPES